MIGIKVTEKNVLLIEFSRPVNVKNEPELQKAIRIGIRQGGGEV